VPQKDKYDEKNRIFEINREEEIDIEDEEFRFVETGLSGILNTQTHRGLVSSNKKKKGQSEAQTD
jgi:hypothetical protein